MSFDPNFLPFRSDNYQNQEPSKPFKHKLVNSYGPVRKKVIPFSVTTSSNSIDWKVVYHGTSKENAKIIAEEGLHLARKTTGATKLLKDRTGLFDQNHSQYHYVSLSLKEAASYAKMHQTPAIKVLVIDSRLLQEDPASPLEKTAKRIKENISKENIVPEEIIHSPDEIQWEQFFKKLGVSLIQSQRIKHKIISQSDFPEIIAKTSSALSLVEDQQAKLKEHIKRTSPDVIKMMPGESLEICLSSEDLDKVSGGTAL